MGMSGPADALYYGTVNGPTAVLGVGFDAADPGLVQELADEGRMPVLRGLLDEGAHAPTINPVGFYVGAVWPSFTTGLSPARHGRYCWGQLRPGTYQIHRVRPDEIGGRPFWATLGDAGRRTAVLDVPHTLPTPVGDGIHVVDWGRHDRNVGLRTWPAELGAELRARFGTHPVERCDDYALRGELGPLRDDLVRGIGMKTELAADLLRRGGWDLFFTVFHESHCAGHQTWHLHDRDHPRHDPAAAAAVGDPLIEVYQAFDRALGRLIEAAGPGTPVVALFSHGMGPHYDATFMLDEILARLDTEPARWGPGQRVQRLALRAGRAVARRVGRADRSFIRYVDGSRRFFQIPNNDVAGAVRINLAGREPAGRVRPGSDMDRVCAYLADELGRLENAETGAPVVRRVLRTADLYDGPAVAAMPDLLVEWNREAPIRSVTSPAIGRIDREFRGNRTGDHRPGGLLVARGPGIAPGRIGDQVRVEDVGPTICAMLGVPLPNVDGRLIPHLAGAPVR
jgi:predicted AlkP superfamily phosphohydrolase/phosphomutase